MGFCKTTTDVVGSLSRPWGKSRDNKGGPTGLKQNTVLGAILFFNTSKRTEDGLVKLQVHRTRDDPTRTDCLVETADSIGICSKRGG